MNNHPATGKSTPVACSLDTGALTDRRARWRALDRHLLERTHEPGGLRSIYAQRPELVGELQELVEAEGRCCPFLDFSVHPEGETVRLELRYPPGFERTLESFLPGGQP